MDQAIKTEWVAALRSGEYQQGSGYLRDLDGKYCCLGVLCDIAVKRGVIPDPSTNAYAFKYGGGPADDVYLPVAVMEWAGLDATNPTVPHEGEQEKLSAINDNYHPFTEIADLIDAHL